MIKKLRLAFILLLTGCSEVHYKNGPLEVTRTSFLVNLSAPPITDKVDKNGNHSVYFHERFDVNETDGISQIVESAVRGAVTGAKAP